MPDSGVGAAAQRLSDAYPGVRPAEVQALLAEALNTTRSWFGTGDVDMAEDLTRLRLDVRTAARARR